MNPGQERFWCAP